MSTAIRTAFGLTDELQDCIDFAGGFDSSEALDEENFADPLPGIAAASGTGSDSRFEIRASENDQVVFDEGSGPVTATLTPGLYTQSALATHIGSAMTAAGGAGNFYAGSIISNKFSVAETGGPTNFDILWATGGARAVALASDLGYTSGDVTSQAVHTADETRYSGEVFVVFDLGKQLRPHMFLLLRSLGAGSEWGTVKMFGHASDLGDLASGWEGTATFEKAFSDRSTDYTGNELELVFNELTTGTSVRYWAFVWRFDGSAAERHYVHLLKAFRSTLDTTNSRAFTAETTRSLPSSADRMGPSNNYPGAGLLRHGRNYEAKRWPEASITEVWEPLARHGPNVPALVVEDFDTMVTASAGDISTATDRGEIFWGSLNVSDVRNVGANAVYGSFSVEALQVR